VETQRLIFNGNNLTNDLTIKNAKIKNNDLLTLTVELVGGQDGMRNFIFNSMESKIKKKWNQDAPNHRIHIGGLNLEGSCINKNCSAYTNKVICQKGMGFFNIGK